MPSSPEAHRATTGVFLWTLLRILLKKCESVAAAQKELGQKFSARDTAALAVLVHLAALLLLCGDIQPNPGPMIRPSEGEGSEKKNLNMDTGGGAAANEPEQPLPDQQQQQQNSSPVCEVLWPQIMQHYYPRLQCQTYFIPPFRFYRVPYAIQRVEGTGQKVLVPDASKPGQAYTHPDPHDKAQHHRPRFPSVASQAYLDLPPKELFEKVYGEDSREDQALQQVLQYMRDKADRFREVMVVLSKLAFRKFLDNQLGALTSAENLYHVPNYENRGFDFLIINRRLGLIVGELSPVGDFPGKSSTKESESSKDVVATVKKLIKQVNTAEGALSGLLSDLPRVNIIKTLFLPNLTKEQLHSALRANDAVSQSLCDSLGTADLSAAVDMCFCQEDLPSDAWWQCLKTTKDPGDALTRENYEKLATRLCVPATTVQIPALQNSPQSFRSLGEVVAETGCRMAYITLYPAQVDLVDRKAIWRTFLSGPPGTGKTVVLIIKGMQWLRRGKDVHVVSTWEKSIAASYLIQHQLSKVASPEKVHLHIYNLRRKEDRDRAVRELAQEARDGELYVIADEAGPDDEPFFREFATRLTREHIPELRFWAASVRHCQVPDCMTEESLRIPLRCPPSVVREVMKAPEFRTDDVLQYLASPVPPPTDGPPVLWKEHWGQPAHLVQAPENCGVCGETIYDVIRELHIGRDGALKHKDVLVLCSNLKDGMPFVEYLRTMGVPVNVVTSTDNLTLIQDVALALTDAVTVASTDAIFGLERRVVFWIGPVDAGRLDAMSRCTAQLIVIPKDKQPRPGRGNSSTDRQNLAKAEDDLDDPSSSDESEASGDSGVSDINRSTSESSLDMDEPSSYQQTDDEDPGFADATPSTNVVFTIVPPELPEPSSEASSPKLDDQTLLQQAEEEKKAYDTDTTSLPSVDPALCDRWHVAQTFSHSGGQLQAQDSDVILDIPEGAVGKQDGITVHGAVCTDLRTAHSMLGLSAEEAIVSPVAEYFADDYEFTKPVRIVLPCFFENPSNIRVYRVHYDKDCGFNLERLEPCQTESAGQAADTGYIVLPELRQVHILTSHFSDHLCAECERQPPPLYLELYGTHEQRTSSRDVVLKLFAWDGRLKIKDFRKPWLPDRTCTAHDTLHPVPSPASPTNTDPTNKEASNSDDSNIDVKFHLLLDKKEEQMWMLKTMNGRSYQKFVKRLPLKRFQICCEDPKPQCVHWKLRNRPELSPDSWFECLVEVGYGRAGDEDDAFMTPPDTVMLSVELKLPNESNNASTQAEEMQIKSHVGQLAEVPCGHQASSMRQEGKRTHSTSDQEDLKTPEPCTEKFAPLSQDYIVEHENTPDLAGAHAVPRPRALDVRKVDGSEMRRRFHSVLENSADDVYLMQQNPRGVFLLVNNNSFKKAREKGKNWEDRPGTEIDRKALLKVFHQLHFHVVEKENCTADEIRHHFTTQMTSRENADYDIFAAAILSHGEQGKVLGVDGEPVSIEELTYDLVRRTPCPYLDGKPKLLFVQACQGGNNDQVQTLAGPGVPSSSPNLQPQPSTTQAAASTHDVNTPPSPYLPLQSAGGPTASAACSAQCTDGPSSPSDFYIAVATCPGHVATRDTKKGTFFIQTLVKVLAERAHDMHFKDIMTVVKREVVESTDELNRRQQPECTETLNKTLYFFPGLDSPRS